MTADIEGFAFNKAIARLYELTGAIGRAPAGAPARRSRSGSLAQLMAPMTPHLAEEVWAMLGGEGLVAAAPWPEADPALLVEASVTLPVQVNGKRRAEIAVPAGSDAATIEALVLAGPGRAAGAERRGAAAADRGARPDRECGGLSRRRRPPCCSARPPRCCSPPAASRRSTARARRPARMAGRVEVAIIEGGAGLRAARAADRAARAGDERRPTGSTSTLRARPAPAWR